MIAVIAGASAGVGRAAALEFARQGWDVAILARDGERLSKAAEEGRREGVRALPIPVDVANCREVEAAAARVEDELGPIDAWINNAMATIFAPVDRLTPEEVRRVTEVTYLGQVHGMMAALRRMRPRGRGVIVNVGSTLAYRAIPLQSAYCAAKSAVRGFTDSLRCELLHDRCAVKLIMVHLPAVNTPQFDWALNKMGQRVQPVPPIYQPEMAARAIFFAACHPQRREIWVGLPTVKAIIGNMLAPGILDRYLAGAGYAGQLTREPLPAEAATNLERTVQGDFGSHGRFDDRAREVSWEMLSSRHRGAALASVLCGIAGAALFHLLATRGHKSPSGAGRLFSMRPRPA